MPTKTFKYIFLSIFYLTLVSCSSDNKVDIKINQTADSVQKVIHTDTPMTVSEKETPKKSSVVLTVSKNEEDLPINDYLTEDLKPIRTNFTKLNSITEWTGVDKRKLENIPENGSAEYYFLGKSLQKIIARFPAQKAMAEFYLLDGQLSMAIFKTIESQDDYEELVIDKTYFKNSRLLHILSSQDCGSPYTDDYLRDEGKKILNLFNRIKARLTH